MAKMTRQQQKAMFAKWGFDLTKFKPQGFEKVLTELEIPQASVKEDIGTLLDNTQYRRGFTWVGDGIEITTSNNPITGEYSNPRMRSAEKDYASYIGIEGDRAKVLKAVKAIKMNKNYIKAESPEERDFI